jgi:predicted kinase
MASSQSQAPAALSLIAVVGLVASVKSHIARALAKRTGRVHIEAGR